MDVRRRVAYPIPEAAFLLGISRSGLYALIDNGTLRRLHIGRRALIPHSEIVRLVSELTTTSTDDDLPSS